jgi:Glycine/sarcosine/betaine reductase selenoprotein B (GRDB)
MRSVWHIADGVETGGGACSLDRHVHWRATQDGDINRTSEDAMDQTLDAVLGFAPDDDSPIPYMRRTRDYYAAIGYSTPYRWAHFVAAPFTPLIKPLRQSKVALITTAAPYQPGKGDQGPGAAYNGSAKFYSVYSGDTAQDHDLRISHIAYDRTHTSATDSGTWFPLPALRRAVEAGRIGGLAARFHGAPTNRSQRVTVETDAPEVLSRVREDGADVAVIVPNCPVCHQTSTLVARHLEAAGIPTVVMGCAKDIVEHAAAPRFLFSDFPLGNSAGKPQDVASQDQTLAHALDLLEAAIGPQTTMQSPLRWDADGKWKLDYLNLEQIGEVELQRRREEFDRQKELARVNRV